MGRFDTIEKVLALANREHSLSHAKEVAADYDADPNNPAVLLEVFENEALCQDEAATDWAQYDELSEVNRRRAWAARLRAYAYMLRAHGLKPAYINWKDDA